MFTTLNVTYKDRRSLREKLHLTASRRLNTKQHSFRNIDFYTTRLVSYSRSNESYLLHFREKCVLPVIDNSDSLITKYRYIVTLNTVMDYIGNTPLKCAVVDPDGRLLFLLPMLISKCRRVNIYTYATEKYKTENERLFALIGASAIITENFTSLKGFDAVFSDVPLPFCDNTALFGRYSCFAHTPPMLPDDIKKLTLSSDEIYPVLAGLYYISGIKNLGHLRCRTLQKTTISLDIKS